MKPSILITGNRHRQSSSLPGNLLQGLWLGDDYVHGVEQAGGIPFVVPFLENESSVELVADKMDGLLLSGGDDIDPALFGEEPHGGLGDVTPERDRLEILLIHAMMRRNKPILGICRGMQVLNAAFGGTLYQDLPREWKGRIQHAQRGPRNHVTHTVHIEPGSRVHDLLGGQTELRTNSFHHQAVKVVAGNLIPVAWDEEGLVEAVEIPGSSFVVAVQWHPENLWRKHSEFLGLFTGLVKAAAVVAVR